MYRSRGNKGTSQHCGRGSPRESGQLITRHCVAALVTSALVAAAPVAAEESSATVRSEAKPRVFEQDLSALSATAAVRVWREGEPVTVVEDLKESAGPTVAVAASKTIASAAPRSVAAPVVGVNFDGIGATGVLPPDTVGDVGPDHYIQMVNSAFQIFDKGGNALTGAISINALWSGFGGPCETLNNGDPIVRYDHLADRWLLSQFALPGGNQGFHECVAISRTPDPVAGGWFLYDFPTIDTASNNSIFPDYPKIAVWPDAYYMGTQRGFPNSGLDVWAMERDEMLVGGPARIVQFAVPAPSLFLMPSDLDGDPPPAGTPNFFARQVDGDQFGGNDRLEIFAFSVDWNNPANSTFSNIANLNTQPFDSVLCGGGLLGACIPQPGTSQRLETLTVWPMWRLQYRNFGRYEAMVVNHTVDANGNDLAGIRWYELRRAPGGAWAIFQQGTHAPDELHRWMGSAAMDGDGNIAIGYSVASDTEFPGIRAASRLVTDPPGTLPQPELNIMTGSGSQTHSSSRYGNYSSLDVDPTNECDFWYTTEYYDNTSVAGWRTRIASFRNPECGGDGQTKTKSYEYVTKLVCGLQRDPEDMRLVRGFYGTAVNIHNPSRESVDFFKKLALTYPPKEQAPGKILPIGEDVLRYDEALATDCMDIRERLFPNGFPTPYIKGFVVVQSTGPLDVTGVYSAASLDSRGRVESVASVDVEQIKERHMGGGDSGCPDLTVRDIGRPGVSCPGGGGTCRTTVDVTIGNAGTADAGPFLLRGLFDPAQSMNASQSVAGLPAGATLIQSMTTGAGGNCFDPDCTISVTVDADNSVRECSESNNSEQETTLG